MCHPFFFAYEQMQGQQCFLSDNKSLAHLMSAITSTPPVSKALAQATTVLSTSMAHSISKVLVHSSLTPKQSKGSFWSAGAAWLFWDWQTANAARRRVTAMSESFCIVGIIIKLQVLMYKVIGVDDGLQASELLNNLMKLKEEQRQISIEYDIFQFDSVFNVLFQSDCLISDQHRNAKMGLFLICSVGLFEVDLNRIFAPTHHFVIISLTMDFDKIIDQTFNLINQVRQNPQEFIHKYAPLVDQYQAKIFKDKIKTREGSTALQDLLDDLKTRRPIEQKLQWCFGLHMIADQQARKLGEKGLLTTQGHQSHTPLPQRVKDLAIVKGRISEVCEFGGQTGEQVVEWLLIDDGLASRKRRKTLLDPAFQYIGIGCSLHSKHEVVTVIILAEEVVSLVAPGRQGFIMKRQPLRQQQLGSIVSMVMKPNQKDRIQKSTIKGGITNSMTPSMVREQIKQTESAYIKK